MPFAFIQSNPQEIQADALVQAAPSVFPEFEYCFGRPAVSWPSLEEVTSNRHPLFSGQQFPENPYLSLGLCPAGKSVWEFNKDDNQLILIHTAPAHEQDDWKKELYYLSECYVSALQLAASLGCTSMVFPLLPEALSSFPSDQGLACATFAIGQTLLELETNMMVWLAVPSETAIDLHLDPVLSSRIQHYIETVNPHLDASWASAELYQIEKLDRMHRGAAWRQVKEDSSPGDVYQINSLDPGTAKRLHQAMEQHHEETFQQTLFHFIDQKKVKDAQVYKRANIDRRLFSKIRSNIHYQPSKNTVLALAIALELDINETQQLLGKAGFTLSHALRRDIIIEFFIQEKNFNIFQINEVLFCYSLPLLGITENGLRGLSERTPTKP